MVKLLVLLLTIVPYACAQTPQDILRSAQDVYKSPDGYEIKGKGSVQPPNSSWQMNFDVIVAAEPSPPGNPQSPAVPGGMVGGVHLVNLGSDKDEKPPQFGIPFAVASFWNMMAENVLAVRQTGSETLPLNGVPTACQILEVNYKFPADAQKPAPVTYSICSVRHLVLKKVMFYPTGRHSTDPPARWTILFDTAKFNRPAPQWLRDMKELPNLTVRKEWIGKAAPDFKLPDLDGIIVALSSMRGKTVLLDFWSTSCRPCLREMPMVEAVGESHKTDLSLWGISFDQPAKDKKWLLEHQHKLATLSDTDFVVSDLYKVQGIPATVLIGRDGKSRNYWTGEVPQATLEAAVRLASRH